MDKPQYILVFLGKFLKQNWPYVRRSDLIVSEVASVSYLLKRVLKQWATGSTAANINGLVDT